MKLSNMLAVLVVAGTMLLLIPHSVSALLIDEYGQLHFGFFGQILGKDDDEDTDISQNIEDGDEVESSLDAMEEEINSLDMTVRIDDESDELKRIGTNRLKSNMDQNSTKVRLERRGNETTIKIENEETGEEKDLPVEVEEENENEDEDEDEENEDILTIREREERHDVTISTSGNQFVIRRNNIDALANFPLSVDLSTNSLMVTTPGGERTVTILPDQAVRNMLAANVIDQINESTVSSESSVRLIQTQRGVLAYEIPGIREQRVLGFIPITISTTAIVSAETGELLDTQSSFVNQLLDFVSF